jgi:signal transduction histidine kinase
MFYLPITAEKRLEEQIRTERAAAFAEINSVMDSTAEGILKLGLDWTVLYGNRVARDILPDLVIGNNYWECFPGVRGTEAEAHLRYVMDERKEAAWENFYEPYREYYAAHAYPTEGGISIFFVPVTRRKLLEQQLEEERRLREKRIEALSAMAGGLVHEISNPLAIIHGTASELQRMAIEEFPLDAAEVARSSASIIFTSERASRILRGLRGFAREAGHDPMEYASIYDIVEQAFQLQEGRFERHSIELRMRGEEGIPTMLCRETQIGQIVTNLINNAYDAITQQECDERWVSVETSRNGAYVQVDVIDSGPGIDDEAKKHLMEPFFTTKTRGLGMGVGLSLSRAIANEHGGTLTLCEGGQHTCFRLSLPLDSQPQAAHPLTIEEPSAAH